MFAQLFCSLVFCFLFNFFFLSGQSSSPLQSPFAIILIMGHYCLWQQQQAISKSCCYCLLVVKMFNKRTIINHFSFNSLLLLLFLEITFFCCLFLLHLSAQLLPCLLLLACNWSERVEIDTTTFIKLLSTRYA